MKLRLAVLIATVWLLRSAVAQSSTPATASTANDSAGAKSSTVIGCLSGPDSDGHFKLNSMQYRSGVEVLGPNNLGSASGKKVKLSGKWEAAEAFSQSEAGKQSATTKKEARRFQATGFDVMADTCSVPAEVTPVSKKKQQQQKAAAAQNSGNNPK